MLHGSVDCDPRIRRGYMNSFLTELLHLDSRCQAVQLAHNPKVEYALYRDAGKQTVSLSYGSDSAHDRLTI